MFGRIYWSHFIREAHRIAAEVARERKAKERRNRQFMRNRTARWNGEV